MIRGDWPQAQVGAIVRGLWKTSSGNAMERLLNQYCQLFGYSSCSNLETSDKILLIAVGVIVLIIIVGMLRKAITGISN